MSSYKNNSTAKTTMYTLRNAAVKLAPADSGVKPIKARMPSAPIKAESPTLMNDRNAIIHCAEALQTIRQSSGKVSENIELWKHVGAALTKGKHSRQNHLECTILGGNGIPLDMTVQRIVFRSFPTPHPPGAFFSSTDVVPCVPNLSCIGIASGGDIDSATGP